MPFLRVHIASRVVVLLAVFAVSTGVCPSYAQGIRTPSQNAEFHRAEAAWRSGGSLLEAKERLDGVISVLPSDADALKLRTKILLAMERKEEAYTDARRAASLMPDDGEVNLLLTRAARLAGDSTVALAALKKASATIPENAEAHVHLSIESMYLGRHEESEALARVAVALDPNSGEARLQLARALGIKGNVAAATTALQAAIDLSLVTRERISQDAILDSTGVKQRFLSNATVE